MKENEGQKNNKWQDIELIVGMIGYKFFCIYLLGVYNWIFNLGRFKKLFSMKFKNNNNNNNNNNCLEIYLFNKHCFVNKIVIKVNF